MAVGGTGILRLRNDCGRINWCFSCGSSNFDVALGLPLELSGRSGGMSLVAMGLIADSSIDQAKLKKGMSMTWEVDKIFNKPLQQRLAAEIEKSYHGLWPAKTASSKTWTNLAKVETSKKVASTLRSIREEVRGGRRRRRRLTHRGGAWSYCALRADSMPSPWMRKLASLCVKESWGASPVVMMATRQILGSAMVLSVAGPIRGSINSCFMQKNSGLEHLRWSKMGLENPEWIVFTGYMVGRRILVDKSQLDLVLCWPQLGSKFSSWKAVMLRCPAEPSVSWWVRKSSTLCKFWPWDEPSRSGGSDLYRFEVG